MSALRACCLGTITLLAHMGCDREVRAPGPKPVGSRTLELAGPSDAPLVTELWYPAAAGARELNFVSQGGFLARSARDAPFDVARPAPWVVLSHARNSTRFDLLWLAEALASRGYVVAAVDHLAVRPQQDPLQQRVDELQAVAAALPQLPEVGRNLDPQALHLAGFSLGGAAVLRWVGQRGGVRRVVALAPGSGERFSPANLQRVGAPVLIV
ncbi:MAG: hypothetical protein EOO40_04150, partial [Deltaproteobacteria bacterium]